MIFNELERRCIQLSYNHNLTHVSSVLNTVKLLDNIYDLRKDNEPVVLGNCHASLALYVVLEKHGKCDAGEMVTRHGVHASRDMERGIWCSGGSLGQPETVAVGMALADPSRRVWLVTSDGSCMEGATQEAIRVGRKHCPNLNVYVVFNGYGAYSTINLDDLPRGVTIYNVNTEKYPKWLQGLPGHYLQLSSLQYSELMNQ